MIFRIISVLMITSLVIKTSRGTHCFECYQCDSSTNSSFPFCDDYYWHTLSDRKKSMLIVGCPEMFTFCIKKEINASGKKSTQRGCIRGFDSNGKEIEEGCVRTADSSTGTQFNLCFCKTSLCNSGRKYFLARFSLILIFLSLCTNF